MGASKRLVELLQMLSVRWKIDRATINIYHTYSIQNHTGKRPVMGESCHKDSNVIKHSNVLCRGESYCTCISGTPDIYSKCSYIGIFVS